MSGGSIDIGVDKRRGVSRLMKATVFVSVAVWALASITVAQPIQGNVARVGFPAAGGTVFRLGQWIPIQVRLSAQGSGIFTGQLRVTTTDLDGDRVQYTQQVTVGGQGGAKRVWLFAAVDSLDALPENVDVLDGDGALVMRLPMPSPGQVIPNEDLLVLDISSRSVPKLALLQAPGWYPGRRADGDRPYYRNVVIATQSAHDLPDDWLGLEAVDVIFWDCPDQSDDFLEQRLAVAEWVRNGGQLIVGIGDGWEAIRDDQTLAELLPLTGPGHAQTLRPEALPWLHGGRADPNTPESRSIQVTQIAARDDAQRIIRYHEFGLETPLELVASRFEGSGRVYAVAASFQELTRYPILPARFFGVFLDLPTFTDKYRAHQREAMQQFNVPRSLYPSIMEHIGFTTRAALGGLAVFFFVGGYIVVATLVSWWWLVQRKRTSYSWTLFAACAAVASVLSLLTVAGLREVFSRGVQSVQVVDLEAGQAVGRGPVFFGYARPVRDLVSLGLPNEHDFVRPLTRGPREKNYFVTPARYTAHATNARLDDVLIRATLKQVSGHWAGELDGTVRCNLTVDRATGQLTPNSWLSNDLPMDMQDGYLLYIDPRLEAAGVPARVDDVVRPYDLPAAPLSDEPLPVPPAWNVVTLRVGAVAAGEQSNNLGSKHYEDLRAKLTRWEQNERRTRRNMPHLDTLWDWQQMWAGSVTSIQFQMDSALAGLALASTQSLYLANRGNDFDSVGTEILFTGLPPLDITPWLTGGPTAGTGILLLWSDEPGPAPLQRGAAGARNLRPLTTDSGVTLYRIRVPIRYLGSPPQRSRSTTP